MGILNAQLNTDFDAILSDLANSGAVETVTFERDGSEIGTDSVVRGKQRTKEELRDTGMEEQYQFSVYLKRDGATAVQKGDVVIMADNSRLRILGIDNGPARIYLLLDLGDEWVN